MRRLAFILFLSTALIGMAATAGAIPVTVTYSADNDIEGMWYHSPTSGRVTLPDPGDGTWSNWQFASTAEYEVPLNPGETYEHVWLVRNEATYAGFLAQLDFGGSLLLSSAEWEYSSYRADPLALPSFDDTVWGWDAASELGANNGQNTTWYLFNGSSPISGIAGDAQWIWASSRSTNPIFIKASYEIASQTAPAPVPEPATVLLLGSGLVGLVGLGRMKLKMGKQERTAGSG